MIFWKTFQIVLGIGFGILVCLLLFALLTWWAEKK